MVKKTKSTEQWTIESVRKARVNLFGTIPYVQGCVVCADLNSVPPEAEDLNLVNMLVREVQQDEEGRRRPLGKFVCSICTTIVNAGTPLDGVGYIGVDPVDKTLHLAVVENEGGISGTPNYGSARLIALPRETTMRRLLNPTVPKKRKERPADTAAADEQSDQSGGATSSEAANEATK